MSNITRTFFTTIATIKAYDEVNEEIVTVERAFDGKLELSEIKPVFARHNRGLALLKVVKVETLETLYGLSEADFMLYGKQAAERSKETRNAVTKEIKCFVADCVRVNNDTLDSESYTYSLPRKMNVDEAKRFINKRDEEYTVVKVIAIREVNALYYMPANDFRAKAEILPPRAANGDK